jgi:hypothetical protein
MNAKFATFEKYGRIRFLFTKRKMIINVNAMSFKKEVLGVIGKQSPKHPQFVNLPE